MVALVGRLDGVRGVFVLVLLGRDDQGRLVEVDVGQTGFGVLLLGRSGRRRRQGKGRDEG